MKIHAKTKRKLVHLATKKKLLKRKSSQRVLRSFFIFVTTVCTGSLVFAVATTKPTVDTDIRAELKSQSINIDIKPPAPAAAAPTVRVAQSGSDQSGRASWYALGLRSPESLTCASTTYPRGTYLQVTSQRSGKTVVCLVNDYGPEAWTGRPIDLSLGSFRVIEDPSRGTVPVSITVVPAPPASINFGSLQAFGDLSGYRWCRNKYSTHFCNTFRQSSLPLH
jgi:rare lipoprotein A (peptidoglycan hydrolase)